MSKVTATIEETILDGDYGVVRSVRATCTRCDHETESFGRGEGSVKRCLYLLGKECPRRLKNFYTTEVVVVPKPQLLVGATDEQQTLDWLRERYGKIEESKSQYIWAERDTELVTRCRQMQLKHLDNGFPPDLLKDVVNLKGEIVQVVKDPEALHARWDFIHRSCEHCFPPSSSK